MGNRWGREVVCALLLVGGAGPAWGAGEAAAPQSRLQQPLRKVGRGVANILTAPLEIIRTSSLVTQRDGYIAGATVGVVQGAARALFREVAGLYEVVTFYTNEPNNYQPLISPEFVFTNGEWQEE